MEKIEKRVLDYWTVRAHDFGVVRRNEIHNKLSKRWSDELDRLLPAESFAFLMSARVRDILPYCSPQRGTRSRGSTSPRQ